MIEESLVQLCAPTLAGIKSASLFNYGPISRAQLSTEIHRISEILNPKGICVKLLRYRGSKGLLLVYRPKALRKILLCPRVQAFLLSCGYESFDIEKCLDILKDHFSENRDFPHEIGVFLNYPIDDVIGFIKEKGHNYKYSGMWKVYGDEEKAKHLFLQYSRCRRIYCERYMECHSVEKLTVAS